MSKRALSKVKFSGGLDISRYPEIVDTFRSCGDGDEPVIVDLGEVTWIDSVFTAELLMFVRRRSSPNQRIAVVARDNVERMLKITGIDKKLSIVSSVDAATKLIDLV